MSILPLSNDLLVDTVTERLPNNSKLLHLAAVGSQAKGVASAASDIDFYALVVHSHDDYLLQRVKSQHKTQLEVAGITVEGTIFDILLVYEYILESKSQIPYELFEGIQVLSSTESNQVKSIWKRAYQYAPMIRHASGNLCAYQKRKFTHGSVKPGYTSRKKALEAVHYALQLIFLDGNKADPPPMSLDALLKKVNLSDELMVWVKELRRLRMVDKSAPFHIEDPQLQKLFQRAREVNEESFSPARSPDLEQSINEHFLAIIKSQEGTDASFQRLPLDKGCIVTAVEQQFPQGARLLHLAVGGSYAKGIATTSSNIDIFAVIIHSREDYLLQKVQSHQSLKFVVDEIPVEGSILDFQHLYKIMLSNAKSQVAFHVFAGIPVFSSPEIGIAKSIWSSAFHSSPLIAASKSVIKALQKQKFAKGSDETDCTNRKMALEAVHHALLLLLLEKHATVPPPARFDDLLASVEISKDEKAWAMELKRLRMEAKTANFDLSDPTLQELLKKGLAVQIPINHPIDAKLKEEARQHCLSLL